jgi:hypothetical protein
MPTPPKRPPTPLPIGGLPSGIEPRRPERNVPELVIEDPTPVGLPIPQALDRRSKKTQEDVNATLSTVRLLRDDLKLHTKRDEDGFKAIGDKYEQLDKKVDELALSTANMHGKVDIMLEMQRATTAVAVHREKVTIELEGTEQKIKLEDAADERRFRRKKWLKIFGLVATLATGLAAAIYGLLGK